MRLIVDGNSYLNAALLGGIDHEEGWKITTEDGKEVQVNSAQYAVDRFFNKLHEALSRFNIAPRGVILVWDGKNAKTLRNGLCPGYKAGRDKCQEVNDELNKARELVTGVLLNLGAYSVDQDGREADDIIAHLVQHLRDEPNMIASEDGDLCVLVEDNTYMLRGGKLSVNPYGDFPRRYITVFKSLVGDPCDKIPGAKGFGEVAFKKMLDVFGQGCLEDFQQMLTNDKLEELEENVKFMPELRKVLDSRVKVIESYKAAKLYPEMVNTLKHPWNFKVGMLKQKDYFSDHELNPLFNPWYGSTTLVDASNFDEVFDEAKGFIATSPFVALDIETSACPESEEWTERLAAMSKKGKKDKVDSLGHTLTGCSLTFGDNNQHTIYMSVDHADTDNITVDQCRQMIELIPQSTPIVVQNRNFEFSVLYRTWGDKWKDNGWHGFVPNAIDTLIGASYVDENHPLGLKERSLRHLGYAQTTYEEATTKDGVQYRMNQLSAEHVLAYGADDTICTAALHNHYQLVMQLEGTWKTYLEVEQMPEYLTSLAFVQGVPLDLALMRKLEKADEATYEGAWETVREFLIDKNWEGASFKSFETLNSESCREALKIVLGPSAPEFSSRKKKFESLAFDIREQFPNDSHAEQIALAVEENSLFKINAWVKGAFRAAPLLNFGSPQQLQKFLYQTIGATPRIFNKLTPKQKEKVPLVSAMDKGKRHLAGENVEMTPEERALWISKASTDSDAIELALLKDNLPEREQQVLKAFQEIKTIETRRSLFYEPYKLVPHWRDGLMHASLRQSATTTRRYSSSNPNVQQLDKDSGFRSIIKPHDKDCVVVSLDFKGQELRLGAELSGDEGMTSCFVGENLRDMHGLTAAAATALLWEEEKEYEEFMQDLSSEDAEIKSKTKELRTQGKKVNFVSAYGGSAAKVAIALGVEKDVAQNLLDAKYAAFPRFEKWKLEVERDAKVRGFALSLLGARRHLEGRINSNDFSEKSRAQRQASNFAIQGSGAEMAKLAMRKMWERGLFTGKYDAQFYFPVHDEVVFSVHKDDAVACIREVHACMVAQYASMKIPIESSVSIGLDFGKQIECGDTFDAGKIEAVLGSLFKKETESVE